MVLNHFCSERSAPTVSGYGLALPPLAAGRMATVNRKFQPNSKCGGRQVGGYDGASVRLAIAALPLASFSAAPTPNITVKAASACGLRWTARKRAAPYLQR